MFTRPSPSRTSGHYERALSGRAVSICLGRGQKIKRINLK